METLTRTLLILHIAFGSLAVPAGLLAMLSRKGLRLHRTAGKIYFGAMTVVAATAVALAILDDIPFLLLVGVFSYYLVVSGYRSLYRKGRSAPAKIDLVVALVASAFNLGLLGFAALLIARAPGAAFGYIALVFGLIGMGFVVGNARAWDRPPKHKLEWLFGHISGMIGGYIATISAVSAVNFSFMPPLLKWLWPTIAGVPVIVIWIGKYRKKGRPQAVKKS